MAKLYELIDKYKELEAVLEQMDEEDATYEVVKQYLDGIEGDVTHKVENVLRFIKNLEAEVEMYKAEEKRLGGLKKSSQNKAERLKDYLSEMLKQLGYDHMNKKKVQTTIGKVGFQKSPTSAEIIDESKLPSEYLDPQPAKPKKKDILDALKRGEKIEGAVLVDDKNHLRIR